MFNELPFPHITATDAKEQIKQMNDYLVYFKESLEFILMNISLDNLSADLIDKLNALGADISTTNSDREDETQQVTNRIITVSDVFNSTEYKNDKNALKTQIKELTDAHATDKSALELQIQQLSDAHATDKSALELQIQQLTGAISAMELRLQAVEAKILTV